VKKWPRKTTKEISAKTAEPTESMGVNIGVTWQIQLHRPSSAALQNRLN